MPISELQSWLDPPWAHAMLVPFAVGLIAAELFHRLRLSGLAVVAGIAATALVTLKPAWPPTLSTVPLKIVAVALIGALVGLLFDLIPKLRGVVRYLAAGVAPIAAVAIGWDTLASRPTVSMAALGLLAAVYSAWTAGALANLAALPERAAAAGATAGIGAGLSIAAADSGPLGALALASGAASAAYLGIQLITNQRLSCGATFVVPLGLVAALGPSAALLSANLPWTVPLALALIPALAHVPISDRLGVSARGLIVTCVCALAAAGAVALARFGSVVTGS